MRNPLKLLAPQNPCTFFASGNGSLQAQDKSGLFSLTASGALRYQAASGARINLIKNPRLGVNTTGWSTSSGGTQLRVTDSVLGPTANRISGSAAGAGAGPGGPFSGGSAQIASKGVHTASFDAVSYSGATDWMTDWYELDAAGNALKFNQNQVAFTATATPKRFVATYTPTATGTHYVACMIRRASSVAGVIDVTRYVLEAGNVANPTYFDGSTGGGVWLDPITGQLGTAHASPSVSQAAFWVEEGTTNLLINPSASADLTSYSATANATVTRDTSYARIGAASVKSVTSGVAAAEGMTETINSLSLTGAANSYIGSIYARGSGTVYLELRVFYSDTTILQAFNNGIVLTDAWTRYATAPLTLDPAKTVTSMVLYLRTYGTAQAVTFWATNGQVEQKAYVTSYCDGSLGTGYSWSGTANASSSTRAATTVKDNGSNYLGHISPYNGALVLVGKRDVDTGGNQISFSAGQVAAAHDYLELRIQNSNDKWTGITNSNNAGYTSAAGPVSVVGAFDTVYTDWSPAQNRLAVNGGAFASAARNPVQGDFSTANGNDIGHWNGGSLSGQLNGAVGPVAIYSRPLTDAELAKVVALGPSLAFDSLKALR